MEMVLRWGEPVLSTFTKGGKVPVVPAHSRAGVLAWASSLPSFVNPLAALSDGAQADDDVGDPLTAT